MCTSIIVAAELRYEAAKRGSRRLSAQLEAVLGALDVLPFEAPADITYGVLRARLEQAGRPIGGNDLLIAAQVIALGYTLVTDNEREFARIRTWPGRTGCIRRNERVPEGFMRVMFLLRSRNNYPAPGLEGA